jgi:hypothetical protein
MGTKSTSGPLRLILNLVKKILIGLLLGICLSLVGEYLFLTRRSVGRHQGKSVAI